jgi:hypothetical protein
MSFLRFIESLLASHNNFTFLNSIFMFDSSSVGLSDEAKILVSSANNRKESFCEELIISFIYIRNNRGPSELP